MTSKHTSIHRISSSHCGYAGPAGQPQGPWAAPTRSPRSDTFRPSHSAAPAWVPRGPNEKMDGSMDIHRYIYIYTYIYICIQLIWELKISGISTLVQSIFVWKPCFYTTFVQIHAHTIFFSQGCGVWFSQKEASTCLMHKSSVKARMSDAENTWSHWPRHHAGAVNTIFEIPPDNAVQRSINGWKIAGYSPTI
jgi:hypothetical protein